MRDRIMFHLFQKPVKKVFDFFMSNLNEKVTIHELSEKTGITYSHLYKIIHKLEKEDYITIKRVGRAKVCSVNFEHEGLIYSFSLLSNLRKEQFGKDNPLLKQALNEFKNSLIREFGFSHFSIILFGSRAKNTSNKKSDVDLLIILPTITQKEEDFIQKQARSAEFRYGFNLSPIILNGEEFKKMLKKKKTNITKESTENGIPWSGNHYFWYLVIEAMK